MSLKTLVGSKIMNDVIRATSTSHNKNPGSTQWRVLVVDKQSMKMVSACTTIHELTEQGITLVEMIDMRRQPMDMEAIYLITPSDKSVQGLISDFQSQHRPQYRAAHVYFTEACPEERFKEICNSLAAKRIRTLKEINIAFTPTEAQAFTLDKPQAFQVFYNPNRSSERSFEMESMAEQLATLCATLGEYPSIRYRADCERNQEFAQMVQQKLDAYKAEEPTMGEGPEKSKSILLLLDRGFDAVSSVVHELTLQAMAYDLLTIENDVFKFTSADNVTKEVLLDENDKLWVENRHQHIADVSKSVTDRFKKFNEEKRIKGGDAKSMRDLSQMIKKMPQHQKELAVFSAHLSMAESCMDKFKQIKMLNAIEQDLATGYNKEGNKLGTEVMSNIVNLLVKPELTTADKARLIILYTLSRDGITKDNLTKLFNHAQLPEEDWTMVTNLAKLGCPIFIDKSKKPWRVPKKDRVTKGTYETARWTPVLKDIVDYCIENNLDQSRFPFLGGQQRRGGQSSAAPTSGRYGGWHSKDKEKTSMQKNVARIIVFIMGGATYSEFRVGYELTNERKTWEVIVGGSQILTPEGLLNEVKELSNTSDDSDK